MTAKGAYPYATHLNILCKPLQVVDGRFLIDLEERTVAAGLHRAARDSRTARARPSARAHVEQAGTIPIGD